MAERVSLYFEIPFDTHSERAIVANAVQNNRFFDTHVIMWENGLCTAWTQAERVTKKDLAASVESFGGKIYKEPLVNPYAYKAAA